MDTLKIENQIPATNGGFDIAAITALVNSNRGMSPEAIMSMCQQKGMGSGGDLFVLILLLLLLGGNNGGGLFGNNGSAAGAVAANQNFDTNVLLRAIDGTNADVRALAAQLNSDYNSVNTALCSIKNGIDTVAGQVNSTSKDVINAIQAGNCQISRQLSDCCCAIQKDIAALNTNVVNGFSQVGFQTQQQTCEIKDLIREDGEKTRSLILEDRAAHANERALRAETRLANLENANDMKAYIDRAVARK